MDRVWRLFCSAMVDGTITSEERTELDEAITAWRALLPHNTVEAEESDVPTSEAIEPTSSAIAPQRHMGRSRKR